MPRVKIQCDYQIKSSKGVLFQFLTTAEGLAQWFAEHVDITGPDYSFFWNGSEEEAKLLEMEEDVYVRYKLEDMEDGEYLEFRIGKSDVSYDALLFITDFVEDYDVDDQRLFWDSQIDKLKGSLGGAN